MRKMFVSITLVAAGLLAVYLLLPRSAESQSYNTGNQVNTGSEWTVTHALTCPADLYTVSTITNLAPRKNITLQNNSAATCYATFDASTPTTTGSNGYKLAAGDTASFDFGSSIPVKVACNATISSPSCINVLQAR